MGGREKGPRQVQLEMGNDLWISFALSVGEKVQTNFPRQEGTARKVMKVGNETFRRKRDKPAVFPQRLAGKKKKSKSR